MPFNGQGVFTRIYSWVQDAANGLLVDATRMDADTNDIANALNNCVTRDGQSAPLADLPMGGFKLTGLGTGSAPSDAVNFKQVFTSPTFTGVPTAPTAPTGTNTDQIATAKFVQQAAFQATLPLQPGGTTTYDLVTANSVTSWLARPDATGKADYFLVSGAGGAYAYSNQINVSVFSFVDGTDKTKKVQLDASALTTGTTRTVTMPDRNVMLGGFTHMAVLTSTQTWTAPAWCSLAQVAVGDGGTGGRYNTGGSSTQYYRGGEGGNAGISVLPITPNGVYTATIGAGSAIGVIPSPGGSSSFAGPGITTLTSANATLKVPGGAGDSWDGDGGGLGGGALFAPVGSTGYGAGGTGGNNAGTSGTAGQNGVVIIFY